MVMENGNFKTLLVERQRLRMEINELILQLDELDKEIDAEIKQQCKIRGVKC